LFSVVVFPSLFIGDSTKNAPFTGLILLALVGLFNTGLILMALGGVITLLRRIGEHV
jgi:hypothetical protein